MKNVSKKNFISIILAIISTMISFSVCEPIAFKRSEMRSVSLFVTIVISFLIFMYVVWNCLINFIIKLKNRDKMVKKFLKHFIIYFGIMLFFQIILWPGHWLSDEIDILQNTKVYSFYSWQSIITQIYYSMALLICPHPVSIVIMQIFLISLIIGYIQLKIETIYKNKWFNFIFYILFLLPAIILNNLYVLRSTLYGYITLLFFSVLLFDNIEKRKITAPKITLLIVLAILMILWRSEGIIFLITIPIILPLCYKELRNFITILAIVVTLIGTYMVYKALIAEHESKIYSLLVYVNPLSIMLQEDINITQEELNKIDEVINVDNLKRYPSYTETPAYWKGTAFRRDYCQHLDGFLLNYLKIVAKNPISFLKARMFTFIAASGMDREFIPQVDRRFLKNCIELQNHLVVDSFYEKNECMKPIFLNLKANVESFLSGENIYTSEQYQIIKVLFWNFIPVLIVVLFIVIDSLVKKRWLMLFICLSLLAKAGVIFLTAPASYFMYYYPEYITGFFIICFSIYEKIRNKNLVNINYDEKKEVI